MKNILILSLLLFVFTKYSFAQNVGIGTTTPTSPLTVVANFMGKGIIQKTGEVEIGFYSSNTGGFMQTWTNHPLYFATNNGIADMVLYTNGNFGIGIGTNTPPAQRLHVAGSAAITANLGIGTTAPTANLDVNGTLRFRASVPVKGSILTSDDANGNAVWKPGRIAFSAGGVLTNYTTVPHNSARRVQFGTGAFYDLAQSYNLLVGAYGPTSSSFIAPVDGIYHFDIGISMYSPWELNSDPQPINGRLTFKRNSGGVVTEMAEAEALLDKGCCSASMTANISRDVFLKAGDFVYVEIIQSNEEGDTYTIEQLPRTYFNGHIVVAL
jgi:hypothetical protein